MTMKKWRGHSKGQAIVEFTLIFPLLFVLVGAAVDWGMGLMVSHMVQNAAYGGARLASVMQNPGTGSCTIPGCNTELTGTPLREVADRLSDTELFTGFTVNNLGVLDPLGATCVGITGVVTCGCEVEVRVAGTYNFIFLRLLGFSNISITRSSKMRWELVPVC